MSQFKILGILIKDRIKEAGKTQDVLTRHGNIINSRMGLHEVSNKQCSRVGMIILQLAGDSNQWGELEEELGEIQGIEVQNMNFFA